MTTRKCGNATGNDASYGNDNAAEHHGDVGQLQFFLPVETGENILDREQLHEFKKGIKSMLRYLITGTWRNYAAQVATFGDTCVIAFHKGSTTPPVMRSKRIPCAGLPSSDMVFIDPQEVPDPATKQWLRKRLRKHFATASLTLLILLPVGLLETLVVADMSKDWRQLALQIWRQYQNERKNLCKESLREIQELNLVTGFASSDVRSGKFVGAYNAVLMTFVAATAMRTGKSPLEIYALVRKGQMEMANSPIAYTGDDLNDGRGDGRLACRYIALNRKELDAAFDTCPAMFTYFGWEREMSRDYAKETPVEVMRPH